MPIIETRSAASATGILTIDLAALCDNWRLLCRMTGPKVTVAAVVKGDGYGLGALPVASSLVAAGCRWFFVASPDEAIALAPALAAIAPDVRVCVLSGPFADTAAALAQHDAIVPVLNDGGQIDAWTMAAPRRPAMVQVDSGMSRLGLDEGAVAALAAAEPETLARLAVSHIISHLACSDEPDHPMNRMQHDQFRRLSAQLPHSPLSLAASSGIFLGPAYHFDLVRPGAALYGINPTPGKPNPMKQVIGIKARILQVREIDAGRWVGYGATYQSRAKQRVATVGIGYADGLLRAAGNRALFSVHGITVPVIGRISMDLITVDVTAVPESLLSPGQFIDVVGPEQPVDALATASDTIGYELLTRLSPRLHRLYTGHAHV